MELPVWRQPMSSAESRATRDEELPQRLETSAPAEHRQTTPATPSCATKRMPCLPRWVTLLLQSVTLWGPGEPGDGPVVLPSGL
jgi:hypothetical protein